MIFNLLFASLALISHPVQAESLIPWSEALLAQVKSAEFNNQNCVASLQELGVKLDHLTPASVETSDQQDVPAILIQNLWLTRLALHDKLSESSTECAVEIRNTFRRFRFLEDLLGEIKNAPISIDIEETDFQKQPIPMQATRSYYLMQTRDAEFKLQEGDLMLARGLSFMSATIARLGDVDSQFSHVIMVVKNPHTQKLQTIESYVGEGVNFHDMEWALKNKNSRLLVLRPKNQVLAQKAAADMWRYVEAHQGESRIRYDYALDFKNHVTMSCAEVAQFAFSETGVSLNSPFPLPERPSTLTRGMDLLNKLGIEPGSTFTPGDLEYDSRFEMIAEWRDLRLTVDSRQRDAIMTKVLSWMDKDGATLHHSTQSTLAGGAIWDLRRTVFWPIVQKLAGIREFSIEIPRNMVGTMALIDEMGEDILGALKVADHEHFMRTKNHMTYLELDQQLEKMKATDQVQFQLNPKKSIIFKFLRSDTAK